MNLYELVGQWLELQELLESGEYDDGIFQALTEMDIAIEEKADNYARIIRNMEGRIEAIKSEQTRLANKKSTLEKAVKNLKDSLQNAMIATGKKKFQTDLFSFAVVKNGGALPVIVDVDCSKLPDDLVQVTEKPDLKAIADYINETGDITYAHFGERGESLRIK